MISTKGRYALRIMLDLAMNDREGPISLSDIARRQDLSVKYIESIIAVLNKAGYVESFRGKSGGYKLSLQPEEYTVDKILLAVEGTIAPVACIESGCDRSDVCMTLPLWKNLDNAIELYLGGITLRDIIDKNYPKIQICK